VITATTGMREVVGSVDGECAGVDGLSLSINRVHISVGAVIMEFIGWQGNRRAGRE